MMQLSQLAQWVQGSLHGEDVEFSAVGIDSRQITAGQLFVAIQGEHFDGHDFVTPSLQQGAVAALVSRPCTSLPYVQVADTRLALGQLAARWLQQYAVPIIAITGSNGKTTVKEMLAAILQAHTGSAAQVLATHGNLNNDLGMPLTALRLRDQHRYAVLEMGMNHPGEIRYMSHLAQPDVALINNVGSAHIGLLGSLEAISQAKAEIFDGLKAGGIAVINADDAFASSWIHQTSRYQQLRFGLHQAAEVSARYQLKPNGSDILLTSPQGEIAIVLSVPGLHNIQNALAAAALAIALQVPLQAIAQGLSQFDGVAGRLRRLPGPKHSTLIDDSYNANPSSMKAAIDVLASQSGRRVLVMGDMGELGEHATKLHRDIGQYAQQNQIDAMYCLGELSRHSALAFGDKAQHFTQLDSLLMAINSDIQTGDFLLIKGSRSARMERVTQALQAQLAQERTQTCC